MEVRLKLFRIQRFEAPITDREELVIDSIIPEKRQKVSFVISANF